MVKFIWQDILIICGLGLSLGSVAATNYILVTLKALTESAAMVEANPVAQRLMFTEFWWLYFCMLVIAAFLAVYVCIRPQRHRRRFLFNFVTFWIFIVGLRDAVNDVPILLKILMGG